MFSLGGIKGCYSVIQWWPTLCDPIDCSTPGFPVLHYFPEFAQTHVDWVSDAIQPSHRLLPPSHPVFNFSRHQGLFQWVGFSHQVLKHWSFRISSSNEYTGLISFKIDWLDILAVQGTLKSLLQRHSSRASKIQCSAFFIVQVLHLYMTTGKTVFLIIWTSFGKVMSLLFNMLSRFVIVFLPRSRSFTFMAGATVHSDFGAQENSLSLFPCVLIYLPWSDGTRCRDLHFLNVEF